MQVLRRTSFCQVGLSRRWFPSEMRSFTGCRTGGRICRASRRATRRSLVVGGCSFHEVRAHIDTLFLDGALRPVPFENAEKLPEWAKVGVVVDPLEARIGDLRRCSSASQATLPRPTRRTQDWQQFAWRWAEVLVLKAAVGTSLATAGVAVEALQIR